MCGIHRCCKRGEAKIRIEGLVKEYRNGANTVVALKGLNLIIGEGEFLVVTGKSGAGKTTLVNCMTRLDRNTAGQIWINSTAVHELNIEQAARWRGLTVGIVFQNFELLPSLTVMQNMILPMSFAGRYTVRERRERAWHLLEQVGIAEHAHKPPTDISGGQQQRVAVARALANDPEIIVADEPTGSLDSQTASDVLGLFDGLVADGKTVVLASHDRDIVRRASRAITLADGQIVDEVR